MCYGSSKPKIKGKKTKFNAEVLMFDSDQQNKNCLRTNISCLIIRAAFGYRAAKKMQLNFYYLVTAYN